MGRCGGVAGVLCSDRESSIGAVWPPTAAESARRSPLARCSRWPCIAGRQIIDTRYACGGGLLSPADRDVQPDGILWLTSYRAGRWEQ